MLWMEGGDDDVPVEAMNRSASERLSAAWLAAGCSLHSPYTIRTHELEAPVTPYSPWVTNIPVFYITTGGRREVQFLASMGNFSYSYKRITAVDGSKPSKLRDLLLDHEYVTVSLYHDYHDAHKRMGCLLSHLQAIKTAYDTGAEVVLIFEDDAVPLYSGWRTSLEEYMLQLPHGWEASQLHWTMPSWKPWNASHAYEDLHSPFLKGTGWGTAAYLLHRRAMTRIMSQTWSGEDGKFRLYEMVHTCSHMSVDDCLLGFTAFQSSYQLKRINWLPGDEPMLRNIYKATPPLFMHDSLRSYMHKINICRHMQEAQDVGALLRPSLRMWNPIPHGPEVLVFMAFPSMDEIAGFSMEQVLRNLADNLAVLHNMSGIEISVFLGVNNRTSRGLLSDPKEDDALEMLELARPWGRMLHLMGQTWSRYRSIWKDKFRYIWALDADIRIDSVDMLRNMLQLAEESKAKAVSPAVVFPPADGDDELRALERPRPACRYRYASHVSLGAPMMAPGVWDSILNGCGACLNRSSTRVDTGAWCDFLRKKGGTGNKTCAILDDIHAERVGISDPAVQRAMKAEWDDSTEGHDLITEHMEGAKTRAFWSNCVSSNLTQVVA